MKELRDTVLCETDAFQARLVHYAPGLRHGDHEHARAQISFLLLGDAREIVGRQAAQVSTAASGIKPAGIRHSAEFGKNGALMLAVDFAEGAESRHFDWSEPCRWRTLSPALRLLIGAALRSSGQARADLLWDVLAHPQDELVKQTEPVWLRQAREQIADAPSQANIAALATAAGVHRVYFSRRFQAAFGLPPSLYRSRCMAAQGLSQIVDDADLADAAASAGFADQSHMTRVLQKHVRIPPSQLRDLLA